MKIRLVVTLLATVLSLLVAAPAQASAPPMLTMTFNACGNVCRHGEVNVTTSNIAYQIRTRRVAVAMLQELCYSQFVGVRDRLAKYGYSAAFGTGTKGGHCDDYDHKHGKAFGVALIAHGKLSGVVRHRMVGPSPVRAEPRVALGATVRLPGRTIFAVTTHTAPSGPNLLWQMNLINRWLTPLAGTRPVLFGGDLNSMPDNPDLDGFYASFQEANGTRINPLPTFITVPRKIDYLFGSQGYLHRQGASTSCGRYSDHCAYLGRFQ